MSEFTTIKDGADVEVEGLIAGARTTYLGEARIAIVVGVIP